MAEKQAKQPQAAKTAVAGKAAGKSAGKPAEAGKLAIAVRIRGIMGVRAPISRTLEMLGLTRKNHAVLLKANVSARGMLNKAKDYLAWGEADAQTVTMLIEKKARVAGNNPLSDKYVSENSDGAKFKTVKEFAKAVADGAADMASIKGAKKVFRLEAPKGGYTTTKSLYPAGACGYRGEKINELVQKMIR